jgi:hypothetical protein
MWWYYEEDILNVRKISVQSKNGFLKKSSSDILKVWSEYNWLLNAKRVLSNNVPHVKCFNINGCP